MRKIISVFLACVMLITAFSSLGVTAATLPSLTQAGTYTSWDGSYGSPASNVYYYNGASKSDYDTYVGTTLSGYTVLQSYESDGNYHSLMQNGSETVYVSYLAKAGKMRVVVEGTSIPYHTQKTATTANKCEPALWQLDVDNSYTPSGETKGQNGGMSYVIRLTDGTFIIVDGGYQSNNDEEAKNLYALLCANNVLEGKPVVSAWFITHLHNDHYGAMKNVANNYLNDIDVKGFYYTFPSEQIGDTSKWNADNVEGYMEKWTTAKKYSRLHSGMMLGFAGATVEVLATHEDVKQFYSAGFSSSPNEASTVLRFNVGGQSILLLADAEKGLAQVLLDTYTTNYLKSDFVQTAHHGFNSGGTNDLYDAVIKQNESVLLWPMDITFYSNGEIKAGYDNDYNTFLEYYNVSAAKRAYTNAKYVYPAYTNQRFSLPFDFTEPSNKPSSVSSTYGANGLAGEKVSVTNACEDICYQISTDKDAVRLIGVLNINASQLADYDCFGFDVTLKVDGKWYTRQFTTTTVFESVVADGETVTAASLGGTYLYAVEITGLSATDESIELIAVGTGKCADSSYTVNHKIIRAILDGRLLSASGSGSAISYSFNDILNGAWN